MAFFSMIDKKKYRKRQKGLFITFEGPEGSGKTTQMAMLKDYFESRLMNCIVTREPGGTELGEVIRKIVKYHAGSEKIHDETELLLFAASRAQHVKNLIMPALEEDKVVLCDRFLDSTTAYQGYARKLDLNFVDELNRFAIGPCMPDMTVLLDLNPEKGFERTKERNPSLFKQDRIESESLEFHSKVRAAFLDIARKEPDRVKIVQADRPKELIHCEIVELVNNEFGPL